MTSANPHPSVATLPHGRGVDRRDGEVKPRTVVGMDRRWVNRGGGVIEQCSEAFVGTVGEDREK